MAKTTLGVIIGNRDFFPDHLITDARRELLDIFKQIGIEAVILNKSTTRLGAVETFEDAQKCAGLFHSNHNRIDGVLIVLPNFGDEKNIAEALKYSELNVPILVQAYPDDLNKLSVEFRRDSFCGKISVCNNLRQYGFPFTLTELHTVQLKSDSFKNDLEKFCGVCRVVNNLRKARLGAIGARPNAFNTVRFSEKLLQASGISVSTIDLSEILKNTEKLADNDNRVKEKLKEIGYYANTGGVPESSLAKMAKLGIVISDWMEQENIDATAIQCWNSIQQNYGINACTVMSMMSEKLMPSACEVDITGAASMYALQLASNKPSALVDWNNNYGDNPDKCVLFHCGNWAKCFLPDIKIKPAEILATTLGIENTYGAVAGRAPSSAVTFARITTDDVGGKIRSYIGESRLTDDPLNTFGARAVIEIPELQKLLKYICKFGFEHHVAISASSTADILADAFETYFGWDVYYHKS